jgi:hypothetical protein
LGFYHVVNIRKIRLILYSILPWHRQCPAITAGILARVYPANANNSATDLMGCISMESVSLIPRNQQVTTESFFCSRYPNPIAGAISLVICKPRPFMSDLSSSWIMSWRVLR